MRLLILGAGGQLGQELALRAPAAGHSLTALSHAQCDIADPGAVEAALSAARPDAVVNCAAWNRVDAAEKEGGAAHRANVAGPRVLGAACAARGALLTHLSTDYVFDGSASQPIDESAVPHPLSVYGATKLAGEEEIRRLGSRHQIVRTAWLYGRGGPNFVLSILRLAAARERLRVVADQRGTPTWTGHLVPALLRLIERQALGTFHLTSAGETSWHGFAEAILRSAGIERAVDAISTSEYPTPARRPAYSVLDNRAWRALGEPPLPSWRLGLHAYIEELSASGCPALLAARRDRIDERGGGSGTERGLGRDRDAVADGPR